MKRISIIIVMVSLTFCGIYAQNVDDALRYSQIFYGGTARFLSMGGAFTALGGDISSLSQNPAGIGVFRSSELTITPQIFNINSNSSFNGGASVSDYMYNFNLNQAGFVSKLRLPGGANDGLVNFNFGYSFNKTNNFNQNIRVAGTSLSSSLADYWAGTSEGTDYTELTGPEGIAYDAWIIDTITGSGGRSYGTVFSNYGDNPPSIYGQNIRRLISYSGYTGEHAISFGGNYSNKVMFGITFGINSLRYVSHYEHLESTDKSLPSQFKNFTYTEHFENSGTGFNLKMGAIIKPVETVRIGLAFHTPTWYKISEYFYENITSNFTDGSQYKSSNDPMRYRYALNTPFRFLAGVAFQIKKVALLSADYEFVDYRTARFFQTGDGYDYYEKNLGIKNALKSVSNFRVGGEYRLNKLYLRSGYGYYGKPFTAGESNENLDYSSISAGIGYREQNFSIDFAYTNLRYSQSNILYPLDSSYDLAEYHLNTIQNMFTLTLGLRFGY